MIKNPSPGLRLTKKERVERNKASAELLLSSFQELKNVNKLVIDCSFERIMTDFEKSSLTRQIQECYSHLRREGQGKTQMFITSVNEDLENQCKNQGGSQWVVHFHREPIEETIILINKQCEQDHRTIIMSPDADTELSVEDLRDPTTIFVIGGIVDRSVSRNETSHKAIRLGLESRKLPVASEKFIHGVFNIDSVFLFLIRGFTTLPQGRDDLIDILLSVVPQRKKRSEDLQSSKKKKRTDECATLELLNTLKLREYNIVELLS